MTIRTPFKASAIADLKDRTEYEAWLLEAVYEITDQWITVEGGYELIYPLNGGPPTQAMSFVSSGGIGDWRPGFLIAGAPLVFIAEFKLIDMLLEWILVENGHKATFRFQEKMAAFKKPVQFPSPIVNRIWLQERLVSLYSKLEGLRGTIIHDRHFHTFSGKLQVSTSKKGNIGPAVPLSAEDLRALGVISVSILRYVEGTWNLDPFMEKRLRHLLDQLAHLHCEPLLGQQPPAFVSVQVFMKEAQHITVDLRRVRCDIAIKRPDKDVLFDLRIVLVNPTKATARAFHVPWATIANAPELYAIALEDLAKFECPLPREMNVPQEMSNCGTDSRDQ